MKTGGTCTLHKNYKTAQLGTQLERLKFNPSVSPSPSLWIQTLEQRTLCTVLYLYCRHSTTTAWRLQWLISFANLGQMTDISLEKKVRKKNRKALNALYKFDSKLNVAQLYLLVVDKYSKCVTHYVMKSRCYARLKSRFFIINIAHKYLQRRSRLIKQT